MAVDDFSLASASPDELRRLVAEVLAEALPGLARTAGPVPRSESVAQPTARQASVPIAGRVPSGVPAGLPSEVRSGVAAGLPSEVPSGVPAGVPPIDGQPAGPSAVQGPWTVCLNNDSELREFVLRVLKLADNPKLRRDLIAGRIKFSLAAPSAGVADRAVHRVDKGAVTERTVAAAAKAGARLVLGPRAVLTPLAKDKARTLGVQIDKER